MDLDWTSYFNGFWVFALLCVLFMAIMMMICRGMHFFPSGVGGAGRCCGAGEVSEEQNDVTPRVLNG